LPLRRRCTNFTAPRRCRRPSHLFIAFLTLTTIGTGLLAWRQQSELAELRSRSLDKAERAQLQKRLWELEKTNRDLQSRTNRPSGNGSDTPNNSPSAPTKSADEPNRANAQQQLAFVRDLFARPEVQSYINSQQKLRLEASYGPLARSLGLNAQQSDRLTNLLLERQNLRGEVAEAARAQGLDPRENPEAMRETTDYGARRPRCGDQEHDRAGWIRRAADLRTPSPSAGWSTNSNNASESPARRSAPLRPINWCRFFANNPVPKPTTPASTAPAATPNPALRGPDLGPILAGLVGGGSGPAIASSIFAPMPGGGAVISNAAVVQSQTILAPQQLTALQQLQQQQLAQQQVQQIVRESISATARPAATIPAAPAPRR
jgi:hypothetical protein